MGLVGRPAAAQPRSLYLVDIVEARRTLYAHEADVNRAWLAELTDDPRPGRNVIGLYQEPSRDHA